MPAAIRKAVDQEVADASTGWTINTLRIHLLALIGSLASICDERFTAQNDAVERATESLDKRLTLLNESRGQLTDQAATFPTRNEMHLQVVDIERRIDNNAEKVSVLSSRLDKLEGSGTGLNRFWTYLCAGITLAILVYEFWAHGHTGG